MNCQEVMDYMQRQLDGDLDDQETEILMNHTRHCSDCAAMFERLKLLSSGLENLPRVMPSYSLVDAILPRLAELQATTEAPLLEPTLIVVAGEANASAVRAKRTPPAGGWRRWLPLSAVGGTVAAGVIIGMFFINNPNMHSIRGNAGSQLTADATSSSNMAAKQNESSKSTNNSLSASDRKLNSQVETQSSQNGMSSGSHADKKGVSRSVDPNGELMPPITGGAQGLNGDDGAAQSPNYEVGKQFTAGGDGATTGNGTPSGKDNSGSGAANGAVPSNNSSNNVTHSIAAMVIASPISPDNQYQAFIVEDTVRIYTVSDSVLVFSTAKRTGISDLKWSEDSSHLTYSVTQGDGTKKTYVVDPHAATEQEQTSKS